MLEQLAAPVVRGALGNGPVPDGEAEHPDPQSGPRIEVWPFTEDSSGRDQAVTSAAVRKVTWGG